MPYCFMCVSGPIIVINRHCDVLTPQVLRSSAYSVTRKVLKYNCNCRLQL